MKGKSTGPVWTKQVNDEALPDLGRDLALLLTEEPAFCIWLEGPLGAGKTTLTGHILRGLGLGSEAAVTSPTYTYMNEYRIDGLWYAHLDLYRANASLSSEELGLLDAKPFRGVFVEWPEKMPGDPALKPTHKLSIAFTDDPATREFLLQTC